MRDIFITIDVDWAPDCAIDMTAEILRAKNVRSTWFVTHESPAIGRLRQEPDLFEIGIHPNFLPGSSHGSTSSEILDHVMSLAPQAVCSRSHAMVQSGPLLDEIASRTPVRLDSTLFMPEVPYLSPFWHLTDTRPLLRVPIFWADAYELMKPDPRWDAARFKAVPGMKVLGFHPIHVILNSSSQSAYAELKREFPKILDAGAETITARAHSGPGTRSLFEALAAELSHGGQMLKHLLADYQPPPAGGK